MLQVLRHTFHPNCYLQSRFRRVCQKSCNLCKICDELSKELQWSAGASSVSYQLWPPPFYQCANLFWVYSDAILTNKQANKGNHFIKNFASFERCVQLIITQPLKSNFQMHVFMLRLLSVNLNIISVHHDKLDQTVNTYFIHYCCPCHWHKTGPYRHDKLFKLTLHCAVVSMFSDYNQIRWNTIVKWDLEKTLALLVPSNISLDLGILALFQFFILSMVRLSTTHLGLPFSSTKNNGAPYHDLLHLLLLFLSMFSKTSSLAFRSAGESWYNLRWDGFDSFLTSIAWTEYFLGAEESDSSDLNRDKNFLESLSKRKLGCFFSFWRFIRPLKQPETIRDWRDTFEWTSDKAFSHLRLSYQERKLSFRFPCHLSRLLGTKNF